MAKRKKKNARLAFGKGLLIAAALSIVAVLVFLRLEPQVPRTKWRVPVVDVDTFKAPDLSLPSVLDFKDVPSFRQEMKRWRDDLVPPSETPLPAPKVEPRQRGEGQGEIAIIIDDMGLNPKNSARAARLPAAVTLSYLPYATGLAVQTKAAADAGHELMLHLPMEAIGGDNAGPCALMTGQTTDQWQVCLDKALSAFEGFAGVNNHMGSQFTAQAEGMAFVLGELRERGLYFVDSRTSSKSIAQQVAEEQDVRTVGRDVFLDDTVSASSIQGELRRLEQVARRKGYAVAIGHPHAATLQSLEAWIPQAQAQGFRLVSVSALVR